MPWGGGGGGGLSESIALDVADAQAEEAARRWSCEGGRMLVLCAL